MTMSWLSLKKSVNSRLNLTSSLFTSDENFINFRLRGDAMLWIHVASNFWLVLKLPRLILMIFDCQWSSRDLRKWLNRTHNSRARSYRPLFASWKMIRWNFIFLLLTFNGHSCASNGIILCSAKGKLINFIWLECFFIARRLLDFILYGLFLILPYYLGTDLRPFSLALFRDRHWFHFNKSSISFFTSFMSHFSFVQL